MNDSRQKIYNALSERYDMGTFEEFNSKLDNEGSRRKVYDAMSQMYDMGDYDTFSSHLGYGSQPAVQTQPQQQTEAAQPETLSVAAQAKREALAEKTRAQSQAQAQKNFGSFMNAVNQGFGAPQPKVIANGVRPDYEKDLAAAVPEEERLTEADKAYYNAGVEAMREDVRKANDKLSSAAKQVGNRDAAGEMIRQMKEADREMSEAMGGLPVKDGAIDYGKLEGNAGSLYKNPDGFGEVKLKALGSSADNLSSFGVGPLGGTTRMVGQSRNLPLESYRGKLTPEEFDVFSEGVRNERAVSIINDLAALNKDLAKAEGDERNKFITGFMNKRWTDYLSLGASAADRSLGIYEIAKKASEGEELLPSEKAVLAMVVSNQDLNSKLADSWSFKFGQGSAGLIEFMTNMALTGGLGGIVRTGAAGAAKVAERIAAGELKHFSRQVIAAKLNQLPGMAVSNAVRSALMPMTYMEQAENVKGLYDIGFDDDGQLAATRNDRSWGGAFYKPWAANTAMNFTFETFGLFNKAITSSIASSSFMRNMSSNVLKNTAKLTGNPVYKATAQALDKVGATHLPTALVQMPAADLTSALVSADWDKLKNMGTSDYWTQIAALSVSMGAFRSALGGGASLIGLGRENARMRRNFGEAMEEWDGVEWQNKELADFQRRFSEAIKRTDSPEEFKQSPIRKTPDGKGGKAVSQGKETFLDVLNDFKSRYGKAPVQGNSEVATMASMLLNLTEAKLISEGHTAAMAVKLKETIGEFENTTNREGGLVTVVRDRNTGKLYYLLDNKGEVSLVRPMGDVKAEPVDMKVTDWDIVSSTPTDTYVARVAAAGYDMGNMLSMAEGERDPLVQRVNRYRAEEYGFDRQWNGEGETRNAGQSNGGVSDLARIEEGTMPEEAVASEQAPAERVEPSVPGAAAENSVRMEGTAALREGDTAYLGEEPVVVRAISEDGQTAMVEIGGDMIEVSTADLNTASPAVEEGAMPSELTTESASVTDTVQPEVGESTAQPDESQPSVTPEPQPQEERPPLPTQKNGEVDYNTLLEQDPARFIEEWDKVEGAGAGVQALMGARESVNSQIEKLQKTMEKPSADFNKRAADRKKLQALQAKKEAMDKAIAPYEQAVDVVDEMVANGDIPGLGEQTEATTPVESVPESIETPASPEAEVASEPQVPSGNTPEVPTTAEDLVSVEDVEIPENVTAPETPTSEATGQTETPTPVKDAPQTPAESVAETPIPQPSEPESFDELNERLRVLDMRNSKEELDYIKQHYPSQTLTENNAIATPERRAEREAMMNDPVLNEMKERHRREFDELKKRRDEAYDREKAHTDITEEATQPVVETPKPKTSKPKAKDIVIERKAKVDKKFTLYNYALDPKDHNGQIRPVMTGVFLDPDGGWAVSTDGFIMVAAKAPYDPNYAGKIVGRNGGEIESTVPYPKWQKIFAPEKDLVPAGLDYDTVYKQLAALEKAKKELPIDFKEARLKKSEIAIVFPITVNGKTKWYKADNLQRFVDAMLHFGVKASDIMENKGELRALQVNTDEVRGALMPLRLTQADFQEGRYIYLDPKSGEVEISKDLQHYIADFPLKPKEGGNTPKFQKQIEPASSNPVRDAVVDVLRNKGKLKVFDDGTGQEIIDAYYRGDTETIRGYKFFKSPDGQTIYGFEKDDTIYIDPKAPTDTPIHEYTHLWAKMFRKINPKEWANIIKLMKGTGLWEAVRKAYPELKTESDIAEEVLSHYSGKRGAERIEAEMKRIRGDKSMSASMKMKALQALHNLRMALDKFWKTIAEYLGMKFTTAEEVADRVLADIERGINPREVMKKVSESNRQVVKAREVLDYFKSKGFKNGEIIRSITDHGVSTYIYGDWGTGYLTKYRISDHGMGAFRAATEISFHQDTNPQTLYRLGAGRMAPSGEQQQQGLSEGNEIAQLWEKHEEELSGYDFQKQQTPLDLKEAIEKYPVLGRAKYLQQRVNSDGKFTYEYSVPHSSGKNPQRPSLGMLRGIDSENPGGNIRATEIREQRELDTPLGRKLNEAGPTKKELVAEAKRKMPDTKIVDKNGEPLVVYHDTNSKMYVNKETGENWENLDWKAKEVWRERDDWDEHWEERDFYTFDNKGHGRESIEMPAFFFTPNPDPYHEYGERRISAFLNIKNPAINPNIENAGVTNTAGRDAMNKLIEQGYDGIIRTNDAGEIEEVAAFFPEQIKSADPITYDDNGNPIPLEDRFDSSKSDIRFSKPLEERLDKALSETDEKIEAAQATRRAKLDEINKKVKKVHKYLRDYMKKNLAQSAQRGYDKETVKAVTDLAKDLIKEKLIDTESLRGLNSLLTTISHVTGRESIKSSVMGIMHIVASNQIRNEKEYLNELLKTKGMKINSNGVKVQGRVDVFTQNYLKALSESKDMEREDIQDLYDRALDEYSKAPGDDERTRGLYAGYSGAMDYADQVRAAQSALKAKENHIEATRKQMWEDYEAHKGTDEGKQKLKVYKEFLDASRDEMLRARLNLANDFRSFNDQVATYVKLGKAGAKDFKAREMERIDKIHHYANSDLKGREVSDQPNKGNIATNNPVTRVFLSSLPTFEMYMKLFGRKSTRGEGNLYKHFVHGFQSADDAEFTNLDNSLETIKKKGKEIFGRNTRLGQAAFQSERGAGIKVTWLDAGKPKEFEISQGIGAYIHAVNKMTDGKMHLRAMGITEEDVAKIESKVDEKYIRFIDWLQDEFLPELWYRFNDVHQKVFGASLSKIDHYFPLKVNKNALIKQESIDDDGTISLPSTITGNIKTRTNNVAPLDLLNSNAFSVALQYMQDMEHWAAYVPMIKDLNALISYKPFRNKVKGMVTAYGNGNQTWETFLKCCRLAAGVYHPLGYGSEIDKYTVNLTRSLAAAKIALRVYTAFKQFFSAPAYISDASPVFLAKNISNPVSWAMSWNWCYDNLPNFKKRWKSRIAGETRLLPSDKDWKMWSTKIADIASKIGLTPNAFVDALTVSIGAKSIYETRRYSYLRQGFPKEQAETKAKLDAEIAYNETQQSSGGMYVAPIQIDRTAWAFTASTFRNASFAYERQVVQGLRNLRNMTRYGQKEMVDYMTKQATRDGADEAKARRYFKWEYKKAWVRENIRVALFGYGMQFAWYAGASMPYFIWGRDKKKKQNYLETSAINAAFGPVEGLPYGGTISSWGTKAVMGDKNAWGDPNIIGSTLLGDDVDNAIRLWGNDQMAAANETINLLVQMGIGINPQTVWDVFLAIDDAVNGDPDIERETLLCMMRVLQVPQSQVNEIFIDEMGLPASKCSELTVNQFAKRYAEYRLKRGAYVTRGGYSDDKEAEVMKKYEKQFKKYWKERIKLDEGDEAVKSKTLKELKAEADAALKAGDQDGYEKAVKGYRSQKTKNAFKNAKKKLNDAIAAETDPEKRAKLDEKLRKLEMDEQEKTIE